MKKRRSKEMEIYRFTCSCCSTCSVKKPSYFREKSLSTSTKQNKGRGVLPVLVGWQVPMHFIVLALLKTGNHRIIEYSVLERTCQGHPIQLLHLHRRCHTMCLRALTEHFLNSARLEHFPGSLFQCLTTLCVKNLFLISNLNLP